jgi:hypothetical protein
MKTSVLFTLAGTVCCLASVASAQVLSTSNRAPAKQPGGTEGVGFVDNCGDAASVGVGTYSFDLNTATNDYAGTCGGTGSAADQWLKFTAAQDGLVTVSTCGLSGGDTTLTVLDGCGGAQIICLDDFCGLETQVTFAGVTGGNYLIRIAGYNGALITGQVAITQSGGGGGGGGNDNCADATVVTDGLYDFDTSNATPDGAPSCGLAAGSPDVWFKHVAESAGTLVITTCNLAGHDTVLAAFDGCAGAQIACNDDTCGLQSQIAIPVAAGAETLIAVSGFNGQSGPGQIRVTFLPPCELVRPNTAVDEQEECQTDATVDTNGGCNIAGFPVEQVSNNSYIWGTASTFFDSDTGFDTRDTDWYEINHEGGLLTVTGQADFNLRLFILDNVCPDVTVITTGASAGSCSEVTVSADLPAGTYRIFAGLDGFSGLECGGDNNYLLTIGEPASCPSADFNGDNFVDFFDYDDFVACFEGNCAPGQSADFNGDEFVDFFDYDDFVYAFEGCPQ